MVKPWPVNATFKKLGLSSVRKNLLMVRLHKDNYMLHCRIMSHLLLKILCFKNNLGGIWRAVLNKLEYPLVSPEHLVEI